MSRTVMGRTFRNMMDRDLREAYDVIKPVIQTTFKVLLMIFLLVLLIQQLNPSFVYRYINTDYFLVVVLVLSVLAMATGWKDISGEQPEEAPTQKDYILIFSLGIIGAVLIGYKLGALGAGGVAYPLSVLGGAIIIVLSMLIRGWDLKGLLGGPPKEGESVQKEGKPPKKLARKPGKTVEGYCIKCKAKHEMKNAQDVTLKNGRRAKKGFCSVCGSAMYKMDG